jgi:hypothetical protein
MLKRAACEKQVVWPMNIAGIGVRALDTVQLGTSRYGLSNYAWTVSTWGLSSDFGVVLNVREENAEIYDDGTPVAPVTPPEPQVPTAPVQTMADITATIGNSYITGLTFSVADNGNVTVSDHNRVYVGPSKTGTVAVDGATVPAPGGTTAGDVVAVYYDDPELAGGAVVYQMLVLTGGTGDLSPSSFSAANPYRHQVGVAEVPAAGATTGGGSDLGSGGGAGGSGGGWGSRQSSI